MNKLTFEEIESKILDLDLCENLDQILSVLQRYITFLGFDSFTYWLRWPTSDAQEPLFISTYPDQFIEQYISNDYQSHDMVGRLSSESNTPFQWSQIEKRYPITKGQALIFDDSRAMGMRSGGSIPIHGPNQIQATFSVVSNLPAKAFDDVFFQVRHELHIIATYAHEKILKLGLHESLKDVSLTPRETDVLTWVARGKTYWEVGEILGIKEDTVKKFMRNIFKVLNASNNTHAVSKAVINGLIIP